MTVFFFFVITCCAIVCGATYVRALGAFAAFASEEYFHTFIPGYFACATREPTVGTCTVLRNLACGRTICRNDATLHIVRKKDTSVSGNRETVASVSHEMAEPPEQFSAPELCRVAVRLPPFWPDRPAIWFAQAESQFELSAITRQ